MSNFLDRHSKYLRYLFLLSFITFAILFAATTAHAAWYTDGSNTWSYRKQIKILGANVAGNLSNFPVLVYRQTDGELAASALSDGGDIVFTSSDEVSKIPHEIESYNNSNGELVAWVKVPSVTSGSGNDTVIYMYYGSSAGNQEETANVWSDYEGVWHLNEAVSDESTAGTHYDSTSNNNDGTQHNNNDATGKILRGQDFDGDNDYISVPHNSNGSLQPTTVVTLSGWIKLGSFGSGDEVDPIIRKGEDNDNNYQLIVDDQKAQLVLDGGDGDTILGSTTLSANTWYYIVGTWQSGGQRRVYLNGVQNGSTGSFTGPIGTDTRALYMGGRSGSDYSDSTLDEVRISKTYHSAQWIQTEYTNQNDPANFITVDVETSQGGGGNQAPVVEAGTTKVVTLPDTDVVLSDATASDPDSGPGSLVTTWSQLSGPATVTFSPDVNELNPTVSDLTLEGDYVLKLSAYDGETTVEDTITITVNPESSLDVSGYSCNVKITILGSQVQGGPHDNFPVLISHTDDSLKNTGCGVVTDSNGYDILFTDAFKTTQLDHEIEKYDGDTGEIVAWVKVDLNASPNDTEIYMYFGKSGTGDQQNPTGVWDNNYVGVWHLKENPEDAAPQFNDSTSNDNNGTAQASMDSTDQVEGQIDGSIDLNEGSNQYISVGTSASLNPTNYITVEAWVSVTDTGDQDRAFVVKGNGTIDDDGSNPYAYALWSEGNDDCDQTEFCINDVDNDGSNCVEETSSPHLCGGGWHHLVGTYDGTALRIFIDGSPEQTKTLADATITRGTSYPVVFGRDSLNGSKYTGGTFDEVRISNVARSADWIQTEYNNQYAPSSFYTWEKDCPSTVPPISEFACSIPITIDSSKVIGSTDLVDFPVLISLTNTSLKSTANCGYVQNSNGYDIIFSDSSQTTRLDHEIEKYDSNSGELIAWVRIPTLSVENDTTLYVHFGHSGVCGSMENPSGVWDSNYEVVLHLQESGDGTSDEFKDSTTNAHHGTGGGLAGAGNSYRTPNRVTGKFGYAQDFDGSNDLIRLDSVSDGSWTGVTVQAWISPDDTDDDRLFGKCWGTGSDDETWLLRKPSGGNFGARMRTNTGYNGGYDPGSLSIGSWQQVAVTWDASDNQLRVFKNGVQQGATTLNGSHLFSNSSGEAGYPDADYVDEPTLGNTPGNDRDYDGKMQESRVSKIARSADWLLTEYNNQSDPNRFYSVGVSSCFLGGFSCNRKITIRGDNVSGSGNLTDFPVLIKIENDCNLKTSANGGHIENSNGYDIVFTDASGAIQLDHEIEEYDGVRGDLTAWVRIPTLYGSSDTDIYMYYGKSGLTCDPSNPAGVWSNGYRGVWHLSDTSGATTQDSTSYNTDGALSGNISRGYSGQIYNAFDFGYAGEVNWGDPGDGHLDFGSGEMTLSLWVNMDSHRYGEWEQIIMKGKDSYQAGYQIEVDGSSDIFYFTINEQNGDYQWGRSASIPFSLGTWTYIVGVVDRTNNLVRGYKDGVQVDSNGLGTIDSIDVNDVLTIGEGDWGWPDARIEEVRLANTRRSADWIKTEYDNQLAPTSFSILGNDSCGGQYGFNYESCKKITVDHTQVNSDLSNFPLLIKITGDDDLKTVPNGGVYHSLGYDIVFRSPSCGQLDHEIEKYDGSEGTLIAWVRVPDLSASTDTEIYMYYGDSGVTCSPENPDGLWDPSIYEAVYHLSDNYNDSTSNERDGTNYGTTFADSKIGRGALFNPSDGWDHIELGTWSVGGDDMTIQAWVWPNDFNQNDPRIVSKCRTTASGAQDHVFMLSLYNGDNGENRMRFRLKTGWDNSLNTTELFGTSPNGYLPTAQTWHFLVATYEDDRDPEMRMYRDEGLNAGTMNHSLGGNLRSNSWPVWIGASPFGSSNSQYSWDGILDEVRILSRDQSQDWLEAEYRNQNDPGNFYTIGSCFEQTTEVTQEWEEDVQ